MGFGESSVAAATEVDIERVFDSAALLGERFTLEFAPLVAAWHPVIEDLERRRISRVDAQGIAGRAISGVYLRNLINSRDPKSEIRRLVERTLGSALGELSDKLSRRPDGAIFRDLAAYLTGKLVQLTWISIGRQAELSSPDYSRAARFSGGGCSVIG